MLIKSISYREEGEGMSDDVIYSVVIDLGAPYHVTVPRNGSMFVAAGGKLQVDFPDALSAEAAMSHIRQSVRVQSTHESTLQEVVPGTVIRGEIEPSPRDCRVTAPHGHHWVNVDRPDEWECHGR